jgi:zinc transport system ATP-binding protein
MKKNPVVSFRDLFFAYNGHSVLTDVSFDILDGEFAAVIGPNGGGKTTLLKLMLGLLTPRRGTVRVFGQPPIAARKRIGYMPQHPRLDPDFPVTVMDVVLMGRLGHGPVMGPLRALDKQFAEAALDEVRCLDCRDRPFSDLSTGLRQRVLIARALASDPDLLLLDEPTSYLDPSVQEDLNDLLHRLNERLTLIIVSHDVGFVSKHVARVVCVNRKVVLHPTTEISGDTMAMLYGNKDIRFVDHEHYRHDE